MNFECLGIIRINHVKKCSKETRVAKIMNDSFVRAGCCEGEEHGE